ncbi:MFS transporter [Actinomadura roseirufa]|uniref:MFS transporter n=1 Tax=Actinomadura roseirufa TaxID=2094049 RepID=UPI001040FAD1|nr:MFS transporter [Actinomadura roseirufa]
MSDVLAPLSLLKSSLFAPLFISRVVSSASVGFGQLALAWGVMGMGYGPGGLSLVLACNAFPALLLVGGGVIGDRFRRHQVLAAAELLACASWSAIAVTFLAGRAPLPLLCLLAAAGGTATAIFLPALRGITADLLGSVERAAGNALLTQAQAVGLLVGLICSGAVVTSLGPAWAAAVRGALCGISALLLGRLTTHKVKRIRQSVLSEMREGWKAFGLLSWVWIVTLEWTVINTAVVCFVKIAGPVYMAHKPEGAWAWGMISACDPLGALVGALLAARWRPTHLIWALVLLPSAASLPMFFLANEATWLLIALGVFISGAFQAIYGVLLVTVLQSRLRVEVLARVNSWNLVTGYCLMPVAVLAAGPIARHVGPQALSFGSCLAVVAATLSVLTILLVRPRMARVETTPEAVLV